MKHPFEYQPPTPGQTALIQQFRGQMRYLYDSILAALPPSAERTLATRKLEESSMWLNKAIVFAEE